MAAKESPNRRPERPAQSRRPTGLRHRFRKHDHQGGVSEPRRPDRVLGLFQEHGRPDRSGAKRPEEVRRSPEGIRLGPADCFRMLHGVRGGTDQGGFRAGLLDGGNASALHSRQEDMPGSGFHPRHRRTGHESHVHRRRGPEPDRAERSLLLWLRIVHRDLCQLLGVHRIRVRRKSGLSQSSLRLGNPLHGFHELQDQASLARRGGGS